MEPDQGPFDGLVLRESAVEDAAAIAALMNEVTQAEIGFPWTTPGEVRDALTAPGRDAAFADVVLADPHGRLAGYLTFDPAEDPLQIHVLAFVQPRWWGRGQSAFLLRWAEDRARAAVAREPRAEGVPLRVSRFTVNEAAARLFASLGYTRVRTFWMMGIDLDGPPPAANVPHGVAIRRFEPDRDETVTHAALAEAFADHWGGAFESLEDWRHHEIDGEGAAFDPGLWFLAVAGDEVVGAACCRARSARAEDTAQVSELAVRRAWRRRGIALALLHTAFAEFRRRGIPRAELAVDAQNPTGATHLYERAGMTELFSWDVWEKTLGAT